MAFCSRVSFASFFYSFYFADYHFSRIQTGFFHFDIWTSIQVSRATMVHSQVHDSTTLLGKQGKGRGSWLTTRNDLLFAIGLCSRGKPRGTWSRIDYWYGTSWLYSTAIRWLWLCYTVNKGSFRISLLLCVSCSDYDFATHFRVATTFVVDTCCYRRNKNEFVYLLPGTAFWPLEVFCKL